MSVVHRKSRWRMWQYVGRRSSPALFLTSSTSTSIQLGTAIFIYSLCACSTSRNNFVLVSYETLMTLQGSYTKHIYEALGIESDHIPLFRDGNSKYERSKHKRSSSRSAIKRSFFSNLLILI